MDKSKKVLLLLSAVLLGVLIYFTIDIMSQTVPPWAKKKKVADSLARQLSPNEVIIFTDTLWGEYHVPAGQTLSQIAEIFHFPVDSIKIVNQLSSDQIRQGQRLKVRIRALHQIKAGEVASKVARYYGVSEKALLKANNINNPAKEFRQGRVILIPRS
ncbi:MAG: LysM peptidoglycan-binding domain-containing protein [Bernardetiaceae bacterium]|nr:LysM peptidoglycan-binding domain-containing protein [Bernardetiaceae bacterium]